MVYVVYVVGWKGICGMWWAGRVYVVYVVGWKGICGVCGGLEGYMWCMWWAGRVYVVYVVGWKGIYGVCGGLEGYMWYMWYMWWAGRVYVVCGGLEGYTWYVVGWKGICGVCGGLEGYMWYMWCMWWAGRVHVVYVVGWKGICGRLEGCMWWAGRVYVVGWKGTSATFLRKSAVMTNIMLRKVLGLTTICHPTMAHLPPIGGLRLRPVCCQARALLGHHIQEFSIIVGAVGVVGSNVDQLCQKNKTKMCHRHTQPTQTSRRSILYINNQHLNNDTSNVFL